MNECKEMLERKLSIVKDLESMGKNESIREEDISLLISYKQVTEEQKMPETIKDTRARVQKKMELYDKLCLFKRASKLKTYLERNNGYGETRMEKLVDSLKEDIEGANSIYHEKGTDFLLVSVLIQESITNERKEDIFEELYYGLGFMSLYSYDKTSDFIRERTSWDGFRQYCAETNSIRNIGTAIGKVFGKKMVESDRVGHNTIMYSKIDGKNYTLPEKIRLAKQLGIETPYKINEPITRESRYKAGSELRKLDRESSK